MNLKFLLSHTLEAYELLCSEARPADAVLSEYLRARKYLGSHDRSFISETIYNLLRKELFLEAVVQKSAKGSSRPKSFKNVGVLYLFLLSDMDIERRALVDVFGEMASLAEPYFDALDAAYQAFTDTTKSKSTPILFLEKHAFPEWMTEELLKEFDEPTLQLIYESLNKPAPLALRANSLKISREALQKKLEKESIPTFLGKLSADALICKGRRRIIQSQCYQDGLCEIQDEGSQLISRLLDPKPKDTVLDACAGGGGKTLHLAALMKNKGAIFAYDVNPKRFGNIRQRIKRSGQQNIRLLDSPEKLAQFKNDWHEKIDCLLIDAPCTGSGTVRRNPDLKKRLTKEALQRITAQQAEILEEFSVLLKPNGKMLYATCSLFRDENEGQIESFLEKHPDFRLEPISSILENERHAAHAALQNKRFEGETYLKLRPDKDNTDGFFAAIFRKQ
ncbi:Fmu (Sun) domain protein [Chloroherpeton thalassium ATCC 35110]|uniref:Fmu (Sun) domain protein n=1 Tax=Chloroherpeton thalassium (strain ATCC 35110 / GB-78) TaxID=517418 RepID=B3QS48_CHLT3|nr:RsmB/NOP family class I SAM-dependent RNA methyltransferase [Chloroherpeton thalassium]ACF13993.1 Fmu (Sun) domain protein [Chloroherpeton thalassium ATCC 35110]